MQFVYFFLQFITEFTCIAEVLLASVATPAVTFAVLRFTRVQQRRRFLSPPYHILFDNFNSTQVDGNGIFSVDLLVVPSLSLPNFTTTDVDVIDGSPLLCLTTPSADNGTLVNSPIRTEGNLKQVNFSTRIYQNPLALDFSGEADICSVDDNSTSYHHGTSQDMSLLTEASLVLPVALVSETEYSAPSVLGEEDMDTSIVSPVLRHSLLSFVLVLPTVLATFLQWVRDSNAVLEFVVLVSVAISAAYERIHSKFVCVHVAEIEAHITKSIVQPHDCGSGVLTTKASENRIWIDYATSYKHVFTGIFVYPRDLYIKTFNEISGFLSIPPETICLTIFISNNARANLITAPVVVRSPSVAVKGKKKTRKNKMKKQFRRMKNNVVGDSNASDNTVSNESLATYVPPVLVNGSLQKITEMGFTVKEAKMALATRPVSDDVQGALEWLMGRNARSDASGLAAAAELAACSSTTPLSVDDRTTGKPNNGKNGQLEQATKTQPEFLSLAPCLDWTDSRRSIRGLINPGNFCYQNAVMQCLAAAIPFVNIILDECRLQRRGNSTSLAAAGAFFALLKDMWSNPSTPLSLDRFRDGWIPSNASIFRDPRMQEDAQEFMQEFLSKMDGGLASPRSSDPNDFIRRVDYETCDTDSATVEALRLHQADQGRSVVSDLFDGLFRIRITCSRCRLTSTSYNSFRQLSTPVPWDIKTPSLEDCLEEIFVEETLPAWECASCSATDQKKRVKATKKVTLARLPPILIVQILRYRYNASTRTITKNKRQVRYPVKDMDMEKYSPENMSTGVQDDAPSAKSATGVGQEKPKVNVGCKGYNLFAAACHKGASAHSGHYTAYIKSNNNWFFANDSSVTPVTEQKVNDPEAYLLFYRRV